jgi:hypothetical protein
VDQYLIWCDLKDTTQDLTFCQNVERYLGHLREEGRIESYRLTRRKLGFGPPGLGEFCIAIDTHDMGQLEKAFEAAARREAPVEPLHAAVYRMVTNFQAALYRDFPDTGRVASEVIETTRT